MLIAAAEVKMLRCTDLIINPKKVNYKKKKAKTMRSSDVFYEGTKKSPRITGGLKYVLRLTPFALRLTLKTCKSGSGLSSIRLMC